MAKNSDQQSAKDNLRDAIMKVPLDRELKESLLVGARNLSEEEARKAANNLLRAQAELPALIESLQEIRQYRMSKKMEALMLRDSTLVARTPQRDGIVMVEAANRRVARGGYETATVSADRVVYDMRLVISDAEELLRATARQAGENIAAIRERIQDRLRMAKVKLAEAEDAIVQRRNQVARATDDYVHENPWHAVGVAAGVGLVIGLLVGRR